MADAVPFNLQSLALRQQMQSHDARIDLRWLFVQRQTLGAAAFHAIVAETLRRRERVTAAASAAFKSPTAWQ
jgi:hypothetical protein